MACKLDTLVIEQNLFETGSESDLKPNLCLELVSQLTSGHLKPEAVSRSETVDKSGHQNRVFRNDGAVRESIRVHPELWSQLFDPILK